MIGFLLSLSCNEALTMCPKKLPLQTISLDTPPGAAIVLHGDLLYGTNPNSITASVYNSAVYIQFNQSFGDVGITLLNQSGVIIYSSDINSSVQQQIVIPFINSTNGTYTLIIENNTGWVEGDFEVD